MKNRNVEVDRCGVVMLQRSGELVVFHEQISLQQIGPGFVPHRGPCKSPRDQVGSYNLINYNDLHVKYNDSRLARRLSLAK